MEYIVLDIETTGLSAQEGAEITEIAGCNCVDGEVLTSFSSTVKITGIVTEFIRELTGITNDMVKNSECLEKVFIDFMDSLSIDKDTNLVIHNAEFDFNFIIYHITRNSIIAQDYIDRFKSVNVICSLELARKLLSGSHKLENLKKRFGINTKSHRALNDVLVTNKIYKKLLELESAENGK